MTALLCAGIGAEEPAAGGNGDAITSIPFETIPANVDMVADSIGLQGSVDVAGDLTLGGVLAFPDGTVQTTAADPALATTVVVSPLPFQPLASGQALRDALAGIVDAGPSRPYLLKLEPGIYDVRSAEEGNSLQMKAWVSIEGSGETVTEIRSGGGATIFEGAVILADSSELRQVTVRNIGQDLVAIAVYVPSTRSALDHVTAIASGGSERNYGLRIAGLAEDVRLFDVSAQATGGSIVAYGVSMKNMTSAILERVRARASGAGDTLAFFVFNEIGVPDMTVELDSCFGEAEGATSGWGLLVEGIGSVSLRRSVLTAAGAATNTGVEVRANPFGPSVVIAETTIVASGPQSYGVRNSGVSDLRLDHSRVAGETHSLRNGVGSPFLVGASRLGGGPASGSLKCVASYDESYEDLAADCIAPGP